MWAERKRRGTMTKLKVLAVTALASTAVGVGALANAPSAHAERNAFTSTLCGEISKQLLHASEWADYFSEGVWSQTWYYVYWNNRAAKLAANFKAWGC
jgi:hypothetical protein